MCPSSPTFMSTILGDFLLSLCRNFLGTSFSTRAIIGKSSLSAKNTMKIVGKLLKKLLIYLRRMEISKFLAYESESE